MESRIILKRWLRDDAYRIPRVVLMVLIAGLSLAYCQHYASHPLWTFDLYYFSGAIERHGTYTNIPAVVQMAAHAHKAVDSEGAYGAPTLIALFFQPVSLLPLWVGHIAWGLLVAAANVLAIRKAAGKHWVVWVAVFAATPVVMMAWSVANAVLLTTPLLVYAYAALRDGQDKRAGVALAIATALKFYPGFLLLVLLFGRRWMALKWALGALGILGLVTVAALGWHDSVSAARFTLKLGHKVHSGPQNISLPGVASSLFNSTMTQVVLLASTVAAVLVTFVMRKGATYIAFAAAAMAMLLSQSMTWREYAMLAILVALALKDAKFDKTTRYICAFGVLLCIGTSWSPTGLETGVNFVSQALWNVVGSGGVPPAPSVTQTLGLLLAAGGLLRSYLRLRHPDSA